MPTSIIYVTGNQAKFLTAQQYFAPLGIELTQRPLDLVEIQSDQVETIALDKARQAFAQLKQPLIVNDTSWIIASLGGFPGPYAHFVNNWFTSHDWQTLLQSHAHKPIILRQAMVYMDEAGQTIVTHDAVGTILPAPRGNDANSAGFDQIVSITPTGASLAEMHEKQGFSIDGELPLWEKLYKAISQLERTNH